MTRAFRWIMIAAISLLAATTLLTIAGYYALGSIVFLGFLCLMGLALVQMLIGGKGER